MKVNARIIWLLLATFILGGTYYMHSEYSLKGYTARQISAEPGLLDGATLRDGTYINLKLIGRTFTTTQFKNLVLESPHFRDCTFKNVLFENIDLKKAEFSNVIFENCQFANAKFSEVMLKDVLFTGGAMTYKGKYEYYYSQTYFHTANFDNVVFDNIRINYAVLEGITGKVLFKNMNRITPPPGGGIALGRKY